jgi:hypothetical protein
MRAIGKTSAALVISLLLQESSQAVKLDSYLDPDYQTITDSSGQFSFKIGIAHDEDED